MEYVISLIVNGVSINVQRYGFYEDVRRLYGVNHLKDGSINATTIKDYIGTKYEPSWLLMPMKADELSQISSLLSAESVMITYFSPNMGREVSCEAIADTSKIILALKSRSKEIYSNIRISFEKVKCDVYG